MKTRICLVPATWQLIMLTSAIQQAHINFQNTETTKNYLLIHGHGLTDKLKNSIIKVANYLNNWENIAVVDEFKESKLTTNYWNFGNLIEQLTNRIGTKQADEIWVCKLKGLTERLVFEAYPNSKIFLYEDGLGTYNPLIYSNLQLKTVVKKPVLLLKWSKKNLLDEFNSYGRAYNNFLVSSHHVRRLSATYLYLADGISNQQLFARKPQFIIANDILLKTIESCSCLIDTDFNLKQETMSFVKDKWVLFLGQCFALSKFMDFEEELLIYQKIISTLLQKGYKVLWKEHPRINQPFFSKLSENYSSANFKELSTYSTFSIEVMVKKLNIFACVAASSSSLFYLPRIYNIPTYSCAKEFLPYAKGILVPDLEFVARHIKSVEQIKTIVSKIDN